MQENPKPPLPMRMHGLPISFVVLIAGLLWAADGGAQQTNAQTVALSFEEAAAHNIERETLDAEHRDAAHADPDQAVFPAQQDAVFEAWRTLFGALMSHLQSADVVWNADTRGYFRVYAHPDGSIRHLLFTLHEGDLGEANGFQEAINEFASEYNFGLETDEPYAQCGTIVLPAP